MTAGDAAIGSTVATDLVADHHCFCFHSCPPPDHTMQSDTLLSEFVTRTSADAGLARDLLQSHDWDFRNALCAYYVMKGIVDDSSSQQIACRKPLPVPLIQAPLKSLSEPSLSESTSPSSSSASSPCKQAASRSDLSDSDSVFPKKLSRGISRATDNVILVSKARTELAQDFKIVEKDNRQLPIETAPEYTFTLPDLSIHSADFSEFLEKDLIEKSSLVALEGAGRLNWWTGVCQKLWPLATTGDGNCLLHAASLGMWGFHDRLLTLRKALHSVLTTSRFTESFYRRWRWQTSQQNEAAGLVLCEEEWASEWETLLRMASTQPRVRPAAGADREMSGGKKAVPEDDDQPHVYESLEELHILALAHVLRRPIIVVADTMLKDITGEPFAPIPFGGIYLPIECQEECHRSPLCLTYDAAHFSALVAMDKETYADKTPQLPTAIPLTDADGQILPLQFAVDPGGDVVWTRDSDSEFLSSVKHLPDEQKMNLLKTYMDIVQLEEKIRESEVSDSSKDVLVEEDVVVEDDVVPEKAHTLPARLDAKTPDENRSLRRNIFHSLRRRFGSLRRSMSKSIRSNLGTLARRGTSFRLRQSLRLRSRKKDSLSKKENGAAVAAAVASADQKDVNPKAKPVHRNGITCAILHTDRRHDYQDEMVRNYLNTARVRFLAAQKLKSTPTPRSSASSPTTDSGVTNQAKGDDHYASQCVSSGCLNYGTAATSYLCASCFSDQKKQLMTKEANQSEEEDQEISPVNTQFADESKLKNPDADEAPGEVVTVVQC